HEALRRGRPPPGPHGRGVGARGEQRHRGGERAAEQRDRALGRIEGGGGGGVHRERRPDEHGGQERDDRDARGGGGARLGRVVHGAALLRHAGAWYDVMLRGGDAVNRG